RARDAWPTGNSVSRSLLGGLGGRPTGRTMAGEAGRAGGGHHRGITQESLRERDRGLRLVFKQVPGAIWATDADLRITYAVGRLRETAGLDDSRVVGGTIADLLGTTEPTEPFLAHHRAALAG